MAISRALLPEEARKVNAEKKSPSKRPRYYDPNTEEYVSIGADMEAYLILLPSVTKTKVVAWIKIMNELSYQNTLRDDLLKKTLDKIDEDLALIDVEFGSIVSGFSNMRTVLSADGFETVPEMTQMYNALTGGADELYEEGEYYRYLGAASSVVRKRFGQAFREQQKMAAASWVSCMLSY